MPALGVDASDLAMLLCAIFAGMILSVPFGLAIAAAQAGPGGGRAPWRRRRSRRRCPASIPHQAAERRYWDWNAVALPGAVPQHRHGALHTAQLRRAVAIVRLFAAAPPGGEREAAYQALVRLAGTTDTTLVASSPGALYRALVQDRSGTVDVLAFDARVCAELDRRDAISSREGPTVEGPRRRQQHMAQEAPRMALRAA
jgi:hypothetical protein